LERDARSLLPHHAKCGAEVFYGLDVLGVVTWVELMRADGLIELTEEVRDESGVEGRFDARLG
jgi:hypothetical protein